MTTMLIIMIINNNNLIMMTKLIKEEERTRAITLHTLYLIEQIDMCVYIQLIIITFEGLGATIYRKGWGRWEVVKKE